jgi:hypothetical protein
MTKTETISAKLPQLKTPLPGPEARRIVELDARYISPSYTRSYPLVARRAQGAIVEDVDGNRFLDFSAGIAVVATGHCHPEVVEAIQRQAAELIHMSGTDFYYENMVELASKLEALTPGAGPKKTFFTNSGTEAIECAMKLARWATGRTHFIAFHGCFHGRTFGSLSLTASKTLQRERFAPLVPGVVHAPYAYPYRCPVGAPPERCAEACLGYLENTILKTVVAPKEVAAIVVEPIQGEGGYVVPPKEFLQGLERLCRQHGILLVADEVQSGMGRTGVGGPASTSASPRHHLHGQGHRSECRWGGGGSRRGDELAARRARLYLRWQPGLHRRCAGDTATAGKRAAGKLPAPGRLHLLAAGRLAEAPPPGGRSPRPRPDGRHRAGARQADQGARRGRAQRRG